MADKSSLKPKKPEKTPELLADLAAQGMASWDDLAFLELSLYLGRPAGKGERQGFVHNAPPTVMDGVRSAKKAHSAVNFDAVLEKALETGDISAASTWMMTLSQRCSSSPASPYAGKAANRFNTWWSKALRLNEGRAIAWYAREYRMAKMGRGLPVESDPELLALASQKHVSVDAARDLSSLAKLKAPSEVGTVTDTSSVTGSSLSGLTSASESAISGQLEKLVSITSTVARR